MTLTELERQLVDAWIPASRRRPFEQLWRLRLLVRALGIGLLVGLVMCGLYASHAAWLPFFLCLGIALAIPAGLAALRWRGAARMAINLPLAATAVTVCLIPLGEAPLDGVALAWPAILPFAAAVFLGGRAVLVWTGIALVPGALLLLGLTLPGELAPVSATLSLGRAVVLTGILAALAVAVVAQQRAAADELVRSDRAKAALLASASARLQLGDAGGEAARLVAELPLRTPSVEAPPHPGGEAGPSHPAAPASPTRGTP